MVYHSFKEFWPYYLGEHSSPLNRCFHYVGTTLVHFILIFFLFHRNFYYLIFIPIVGYSFAWFGHFFIEKNRPATFKYPLWSLMGDFKMYYRAIYYYLVS